jgi:hypothetical protein
MLFCLILLCAMLTLVYSVTPACYQSTHFTSYTYRNTHPDTDTCTHKQTNKQTKSSVIQSYTNRLSTCTCPTIPKTPTPYTYDLNTKIFTHHTHIHTQKNSHRINMLYTYTYKCNFSPINPSPLLYHNKLVFLTVSQLHLGLIFGSKIGPHSKDFIFIVTYE